MHYVILNTLLILTISFHPFAEASRRPWELHLRMQTKYINLLCFMRFYGTVHRSQGFDGNW